MPPRSRPSAIDFDGIPLALELAAPQMRVQSAQKLAERLIQRLRMPMRGDPHGDAAAANAAHAHRLELRPPLRDRAIVLFLRQLAAFAGGWTLEAGRSGCAPARTTDPPSCCIASWRKSLVLFDTGSERYRLLETVREYAHDRLVAAGESMAVSDRHLQYYASLVERAKAELTGPDQVTWLARLDPELENILAAHRRADATKDWADLGLRLAGSMKHYWFSRGLLELGLRSQSRRWSGAGPSCAMPCGCGGLFDAGQIDVGMARFAAARERLEESIGIARELDDRRAIAAVLMPLGIAVLGEGQTWRWAPLSRGGAHHSRASATTSAVSARRSRRSRSCIAVEGRPGRRRIAQRERAGASRRASGDSHSVAIGLLNLAMIAIGRGNAERARTMLREVLDIAEETGSRPATVNLLEVCSGSRCCAPHGASAALLRRRGGSCRADGDCTAIPPTSNSPRAARRPGASEPRRRGARARRCGGSRAARWPTPCGKRATGSRGPRGRGPGEAPRPCRSR